MNKILKLAFLFLFISNIACAQNSNEKTLLWRVSGNGLSEPSYLYGTIHIPHTKFMNFSDSMKQVLKTVNSVVVEVHITDPFAAMNGMTMKKGQSLKKLLGEKDYEALEKRVEEDKDLAFFKPLLDQMKPLIISSQLSLQHAETNTTYPMDFVFPIQAKEREQKVLGLETIDEQYNAFGAVKMQEQLAMLRYIIYNKDKDKKEMDNVIAAYLEQDIDKSAGFIAAYQKKYPDFVDKILTQRNIKMISRTDSLLKLESNRLIAIGAGHLGAKDGFISVLRKKGYIVEPVMPTYTEEAKMEINYSPKWIAFETDDFECEFPNEKPKTKEYDDSKYQVEQLVNGYKTVFVITAQEIEGKEGLTREDFYEELKINIKKAQGEAPIKEIEINGLSAVESQMKMIGQTFRNIYIINEEMNNTIVMMIIGEEQITKADFADKFIQSFKFK